MFCWRLQTLRIPMVRRSRGLPSPAYSRPLLHPAVRKRLRTKAQRPPNPCGIVRGVRRGPDSSCSMVKRSSIWNAAAKPCCLSRPTRSNLRRRPRCWRASCKRVLLRKSWWKNSTTVVFWRPRNRRLIGERRRPIPPSCPSIRWRRYGAHCLRRAFTQLRAVCGCAAPSKILGYPDMWVL